MAIVADLLGYIREIPVPESFVSSTKIFFVTPCISYCYHLTSDVSFGIWEPVMPVLVKKMKDGPGSDISRNTGIPWRIKPEGSSDPAPGFSVICVSVIKGMNDVLEFVSVSACFECILI